MYRETTQFSLIIFILCLFTAGVVWAAEASSEIYDSAVEQARGALSGMNPAVARSALQQAQSEAKSKEQKEEVQRLEQCTDLIEEYLRTMSNFAQNCTTTEIKLSETDYARIVDTSANHITVRAQGVNKHYAINQLSPKFVRLLVGAWYNKTADNKAIFGAFEAFHPKGDLAMARKLWSESSLDKSMLQELNVPRAAAIPGSSQPDTRLAIPSSEEIAGGKEFVKKKFASQLARATDDAQKARMALLLVKNAADKRFTPAQSFAALEMAEEFATGLPQISPLYDVWETKERLFKTSSYKKRLELCKSIKAESADKAACKDYAASVGKQLAQCGESGRYDDAKALIPLAKELARRGEIPALKRYVLQAEKFLENQK